MKILVIGSGGREHALVWKLRQSKRVQEIYCTPGNAGICELANCLNIGITNIEELAAFARVGKIDLTIVGPELPLTLGIVDRFTELGLRIFGPTRRSSALEGSKVLCKKLLEKYNIPSARYEVHSNRDKAVACIRRFGVPLVIKADGLAAGKGVIVARTREEAVNAVDLIMRQKAFGDAGSRVVIEEFLEGEEASFLAFTDGKTILPLPTCQDHKAIYDGDQGPNTGGMGAYSPAPVVTEHLKKQVIEKIMMPTVQAMAAEGTPYKGILYAGLMIKDNEVKVLEFNCRFGDPEAQPLLMRLKTDLVDIMEAVIDERLETIKLEIDPRPAVCVVMASGGYPGEYEKGRVIKGLPAMAVNAFVQVFHAGTATKEKKVVTAGGRVLGVTALGQTLSEALQAAYEMVGRIHWQDCYYRKDIGRKALELRQQHPLVGIVMGSDSDLPVMQGSLDFLKKMAIPYEVTICSAHRTPDRAAVFAATARDRGLKVIIAGAGMAAHLAGVLAAHTTLPVIGVPIDSSALRGLDSLLATVQMPPGVPVATMAIGKAGAKNAAIFATQILAVADPEMAVRLLDYKKEMADEVEAKASRLIA
ncbi:MAG: 5-(carboxyamino)imidazole ribonucleotide mutase [Deltaproteobacteria bacterium RIFOXYD12_FULL_50_9]|nr:MAG: 5-(carboxyamino)imidazole ribonucleotide mutase [Deltaproteobacteria bacterium RIFOXYD12_FULL_50_9]